MNELILATILAGLLLMSVCVSWYIGRRAGNNETELKDTLDHQEKAMQAMLKQRQIDLEYEKKRKEIIEKKNLPLTQENVDALLKKYDKLN